MLSSIVIGILSGIIVVLLALLLFQAKKKTIIQLPPANGFAKRESIPYEIKRNFSLPTLEKAKHEIVRELEALMTAEEVDRLEREINLVNAELSIRIDERREYLGTTTRK